MIYLALKVVSLIVTRVDLFLLGTQSSASYFLVLYVGDFYLNEKGIVMRLYVKFRAQLAD